MLTPLWTFGQIQNDIDEFVKNKEAKAVEVFSYVGESFVNDARDNRTHGDITGNLQSSKGYFIKKGTNSLKKFLPGEKDEGKRAAVETGNQVNVGTDELSLVGVAGMSYAESVEASGKDVITPMAQRAGKLLDELIKEL